MEAGARLRVGHKGVPGGVPLVEGAVVVIRQPAFVVGVDVCFFAFGGGSEGRGYAA